MKNEKESLLINNPKLMEEWHLVKNNGIDPFRCRNYKKVWWKCRICRNEWQARIIDRNKGEKKCSFCISLASKISPFRVVFLVVFEFCIGFF